MMRNYSVCGSTLGPPERTTSMCINGLSHGALAAEHDGISPVQDGVGHVAGLCAGRERLVLHGCQHLRGANGVLAGGLGSRESILDEKC